VTTKDNHVKNVPKRHVQVQDRSKIMADEDPIILDIMRYKEVTTNVFAIDVINLEEELHSSPSVGEVQVQSTPVEAMKEKQSEIPTGQ
jgi:predicted RND superfamily exporter protein